LPSLELEELAVSTVPGLTAFPHEQTHNRHTGSRHKAAPRRTQGIKSNYLSGNLSGQYRMFTGMAIDIFANFPPAVTGIW
jgi:hypothetical protein